MSEWQPIETAPKDGTDILLSGPHSNHGWVIKSARFWIGSWWSNGNRGIGPDPSHWMPLPAPPAVAKEGT